MSLPDKSALDRIATQRAARRSQEPPLKRFNFFEEDGQCIHLGTLSDEVQCGCKGQGLASVYYCQQESGAKCVATKSIRIRVVSRHSELKRVRACEECPLKVLPAASEEQTPLSLVDTAEPLTMESDPPDEPMPAP